MAFVACALVIAVVWQSGRYQVLSAQARELERTQEAWIDENRKLEAGISVLSSRSRAAQMAPVLGLEKAVPEDRLRVIVAPEEGSGG